MPSLLDEILTEIFLSLSNENTETTSKNVESFVLAGKQPFKIAFNYFQFADKANVKPKGFELFVKEKQWKFSYNFIFAPFLSKLAAASIEKIIIEFNQESIVLDNLLVNGLKEAYIFGDLHEKYLGQLHSVTSLNIIHFERCKIRFQGLILTKPSPTKLISNIDLHEMMEQNTQNMLLPAVQDLTLKGRFLPSAVTSESLNQFYANICTMFPNLRKISGYFTTTNASWQDIFAIMNTVTPDIGGYSTNAVGEIRFDYSEWNVLLSDVADEINDKMNVEIEKNESTLKRTIHINQNLRLIFSLYFRKTERRRRRFK